MENPFYPLAITPEQATEFYRVLGRALWGLGAFEHSVGYYVVVVQRGKFDSVESAEKELDRAFSLTLGNLIREFRKHGELSPELDRRLDAFKSERDWLCHRIYRQNHPDLLNRPKFEALLRRLHAFKAEATALSEALEHGFERWTAEQGITQQELEAQMKSTYESWKKD